jgi:hypothetical protein
VITRFTQNNVRYQLVTLSESRRVLDERAANIQRDPTLWTSRQKRVHGVLGYKKEKS